jgi:hypothetical protein
LPKASLEPKKSKVLKLYKKKMRERKLWSRRKKDRKLNLKPSSMNLMVFAIRKTVLSQK